METIELPNRVTLTSSIDLIVLEIRDDGSVTFAIRNYSTGEIREQTVYNPNFHPKWVETVKNRARKMHEDEYTPANLVPQKRR